MKAKASPQRKKPVWTSSKISSMLCSSQMRRAASRYSWVQGHTPLSPCTGSSITATGMVPSTGVTAARSKAAMSLRGTWAKPSGSGAKGSCLASWAVAARVA